MTLERELSQLAQERYGWNLSFEGQLYQPEGLVCTMIPWSQGIPAAELGLAGLVLDRKQTYGFIDLNQKNWIGYQHLATVYPGREDNYQPDLLKAILLRLRTSTISTIERVSVKLPRELSPFVHADHLSLMDINHPEVVSFPGGVVPIYQVGDIRQIDEILEGFKIIEGERE